MKKVQELMLAQKEQQNPGHEIGKFLLQHSNNPVYLVSQLEMYLEAINADIEATRAEYAVFAKALTGKKYRIRSKVEVDEETDMPLYWSNQHGWVCKDTEEDVYASPDLSLTLPVDSEWIPDFSGIVPLNGVASRSDKPGGNPDKEIT